LRSGWPSGPKTTAAAIPSRGLRSIVLLIRRLDPKSLGQHLDVLYRAAWALCGSREDAEDLVQETFARVLARPRAVRGDERAYLMTALRNTFYSRLRTASRRPQTAVTPIEDIDPADPRVGLQPDRAVEFGEILEAISELPEDFRLALVAVDILGLSYGEAAKALDAREATITTRLYRARQRIARQLADEPADGSGAREGSGPKRSLA
jgi:RNA polymerase sigma-70 factor, ECF subfamily